MLKLYSKWKWTPYHLWIMKKCSHWSRKWKNFALFSNFRIYYFYYGACKISKVCTCTIYQVFLSERKLAISCSNIGRKITGENTCCVVVGRPYSDGSELSSIQPYYHPRVCIRHQEQTSVYRKLMLNFWAVAAVLIRLTTELLLPLKLCCLLNNLCWVFLKLNNHEQKKF